MYRTNPRIWLQVRFAMLILAALLAALLVGASVGAREAQALTNSEQRSAVVKEAKRLMSTNIQYQFGSCSYSYTDCVCFNRLSYKPANIALQSTMGGQFNQGVRTTTPRPGDLVFFDKDRDGRYTSYDHTGVYIGRDAEGYALFIHAANAKRDVVKDRVKDFSGWVNAPFVYVDVISSN